MSVSPFYIRHQLPVIGAFARIAASRPQKGSQSQAKQVSATLPPRPAELVADYLRHVGANPAAYGKTLPPHLFPQWGFALMTKTLLGMPYDMKKVLNGGASYTVNRPIPINEALEVTARLNSVEETDSKVLFEQSLVTGTKSAPDALTCTVWAIIPKKGGKKGKSERPVVPEDAREVGCLRLGANIGLDFAMLTGDFNPIHWIAWYARMAGFKNTINHGFSTMARTIEAINRTLWGGQPFQMKSFSCRFLSPLVLPATAFVFVDSHNRVYTAPARNATPYLMGEFTPVSK
jgi:hypothetical protein